LTLEPLEGRALLSLTTWTVNSLGDSGTGTGTSGDLRYVITQADQTSGDNTINFGVTGTITLNSALPALSNTTGVTDIEGPGATSLTVARSSASGTPDFGVFTVNSSVTASLTGLTISNGRATSGGGIYNAGTLTVSDSTLDYDSASNPSYSGGGGGIYNAGMLTLSDSTLDYNSASISNGGGGGIDNAGTLTVSDSTLDYNSASDNNFQAGGDGGGGIYNAGTLTLSDSTLDYNSVDAPQDIGGGGGGIDNAGTLTLSDSTLDYNSASYGAGGGIDNARTLTVSDSTLDYNSASYGGGGIDNEGIYNAGALTVSDSTIDHDSADDGGGIDNAGTLTVSDSTLAYDSAYYYGGGIGNFGPLTAVNSTLAYDSADDGGGGIFNNLPSGLVLTTVNSTIAYNTVAVGGSGGGLDPYGGTAILDNTIVALNTSGTSSSATPDDISTYEGGVVSPSSAYNLIGSGGSGGLTNTNGNQVGVADPGLDPNGLQNNGGPTQTIALLPNSPAIDAGSNALAVDPTTGLPLTTDQRGAGFPRIVGMEVDIGAYELQATTYLVVTTQPASVVAGSSFGLTVTAEDSSGNVDTSFNGTVTVALATNPGGGTLGGTLTVTATSGVATFSDLTLKEAATGYTLLVTANGLVSATTGTIDVTPAAATQLVVTTQPPANVVAGSRFGLVVTAEDPFGNVDSNFSGNVAVALLNNPGGATLAGTLSVTAQSGVATFSGLTLNETGTGYALLVSANGQIGADTSAFDVVSGTWTVNSQGHRVTFSGPPRHFFLSF